MNEISTLNLHEFKEAERLPIIGRSAQFVSNIFGRDYEMGEDGKLVLGTATTHKYRIARDIYREVLRHKNKYESEIEAAKKDLEVLSKYYPGCEKTLEEALKENMTRIKEELDVERTSRT